MNVSINMPVGRRRLWSSRIVLGLVLLCSMALVVAPLSASAAPESNVPVAQSDSSASGVGIQAGSALATILYFPLKLAFAVGGGVVGGLAYGFSGGSEQTAKSIWVPSMYGTYIITPDHLKGDKPIRFLGVPAEPPRDKDAVDYQPQEPAQLPLEPIR